MKNKKLYGTNIFYGEKEVKTDALSPNGFVRPLGYVSLLHRLKCAVKVVRGYADIVVWENNY